jgi:hypothetical protein
VRTARTLLVYIKNICLSVRLIILAANNVLIKETARTIVLSGVIMKEYGGAELPRPPHGPLMTATHVIAADAAPRHPPPLPPTHIRLGVARCCSQIAVI